MKNCGHGEASCRLHKVVVRLHHRRNRCTKAAGVLKDGTVHDTGGRVVSVHVFDELTASYRFAQASAGLSDATQVYVSAPPMAEIPLPRLVSHSAR